MNMTVNSIYMISDHISDASCCSTMKWVSWKKAKEFISGAL